eukprot:c29406_g1_i1 orf=165-440(-)
MSIVCRNRRIHWEARDAKRHIAVRATEPKGLGYGITWSRTKESRTLGTKESRTWHQLSGCILEWKQLCPKKMGKASDGKESIHQSATFTCS